MEIREEKMLDGPWKTSKRNRFLAAGHPRVNQFRKRFIQKILRNVCCSLAERLVINSLPKKFHFLKLENKMNRTKLKPLAVIVPSMFVCSSTP